MVTRVIPISDCISDGDPTKWPTADKGYIRNDEYFLQRIANDFWAKECTPEILGCHHSAATWRLDKLPDGYAGFEKPRANSKHVDRYLYGHPRGQFRSLAEFYPHFKHLMDLGGPVGCSCKLCLGTNKRASTGGGAVSESNGTRSFSPAQWSSRFPHSASTQPKLSKSKPAPPLFHQQNQLQSQPSTIAPHLRQGRLSSLSPPRAPRKQADEDGSPDIFRALIDELKSADEGVVIDRKIEERMSPDWRMGNDLLKDQLDDWRHLPQFTPRIGELVLFVHKLSPDEGLVWTTDKDNTYTWRKILQRTGELLDERPSWEAGVVTQMPLQQIDLSDLAESPAGKDNITNSGFRIEPISKPGDTDKGLSKQHRYLPLHGIRPLVYWEDCVRGLEEATWHPTAKNALTFSNTFSVIGKDRFKGVRDELSGTQATIFCQGAYIGSDLILTGDKVRLLPTPDDQKPDEVTDVLVVTSIKIRLVNLDDAGNDDWDQGRPYITCLHISGKAYTLDKKRSYDGVGKLPIQPTSNILPGYSGYGQWYHMTDPKNPKARLEVPFTRILGRLPESIAPETWFQKAEPSQSNTSDPQIQPIRPPTNRPKTASLKHGLQALTKSRRFAKSNDPRIQKSAGKAWFWADTRTEALDLHEVNNRFVGPKDDTRSREQMERWRRALRALDGGKSGLADFHAERKKREREEAEAAKETAGSVYGMVGAAVTVPDGMIEGTSGSGTEGDAVRGGAVQDHGDGDVDMDVDEDQDMPDAVDDDESEDDDEQDWHAAQVIVG